MKRAVILFLPPVLLVLFIGLALVSRSSRRDSAVRPAQDHAATEPEATSSNRSDLIRLDAKPGGSKVRIEGTSTVHDWQVEGTVVGGYLEVDPNFPLELGQPVKAGKVECRGGVYIPVRSLKSIEKDGRPDSDKMNEVMYDHLKEAANPRIYYHVSELILKEIPRTNGLPYVYDAKGELVVAGVTNVVSMPVNVTPLGNKTVKITGQTTTRMTSFGVQPPAPVAIAVRAGDQVRLIFEWTVFQKAAAVSTAK